MATLNLRGRLVNSLLPTKMRVYSAPAGLASEQLVRRNAGQRAAGDAAYVIHPGLERREVSPLERVYDLRNVADFDPAQLNLLAGREVEHTVAETLADDGKGAELGSGCLASPEAP